MHRFRAVAADFRGVSGNDRGVTSGFPNPGIFSVVLSIPSAIIRGSSRALVLSTLAITAAQGQQKLPPRASVRSAAADSRS
jgi:hypothetical protein